MTIDLEAASLDVAEVAPNVRQGILGRLNLDNWRSSSKVEALVEELSNLRTKDATTKSLVFSQFVNFLDLIAFRLQRAGFNVRFDLFFLLLGLPLNPLHFVRFVAWKDQCPRKPVMQPLNTSVRYIYLSIDAMCSRSSSQ